MTKKVSGKGTKVIIGSSTSLEHSPAAEGIVSNVDLLTEILLRVPAKSLIRFKSVSKNWLLLISDSRFAFNHAHQNRSCSISGLYFKYIFSSLKDPIYSVSLHGHPSLPTLAFLNGVGGEKYPIRIKASCNGLLLCVKDRIVCNHYITSYIVCNPTTQKYKVLPEPGGPSHESFGAYLAFDPSKSRHYKVVLFNYFGKFDIYSSESALWKQIGVTEQRLSRGVGGVFWNGAIHWLSVEEGVHFRFAVDAEKLIKTSNPPRPKILSFDKIRYFGECGGHLILIQMRLRFAMGFRILEMDRDSCHWIVKCRVNLRPLISVFPEIDDRSRSRNRGDKFRVLCVARGRGGVNENDFAMVFAAAGKVVSYNLKSKTLKVLHDHLPLGNFRPSIINPYHYSLTHQFVESISPV